MKPVDKFGKPIYPGVFQTLQRIGISLEQLGFNESARKPNLFLRKDSCGTVFADMRGTKEIPIWGEICPLIYITLNQEFPAWQIARIRKNVSRELSLAGVPYRFSFYDGCEPDDISYPEIHHKETFQDDLFEFFYNIYNELPDGYCRMCRKDIMDDLYFCSKEHETAIAEDSFSTIVAGSPKCEICGAVKLQPLLEKFKEYLDRNKIIYVSSLNEHHTCYYPEITMTICDSCHSKIHNGNDPNLTKHRPPEGDSKKFYMKQKRRDKLEGKYSKLDQKARNIGASMYFIGLDSYRYGAKVLRKYHESHPDATEYMRCKKCDFEFDPHYRTPCPKCREFFR